MSQGTSTVGEFFEWARREKWSLRYFGQAQRGSRLLKDGKKEPGWSFVWGTQCGFISDAEVLKRMPKKDWDVYGR